MWIVQGGNNLVSTSRSPQLSLVWQVTFRKCSRSVTINNKLVKYCYWAFSQNCEKWLLASSCLSVRMENLGSHWTDIWVLLEKLSTKFKFHWNRTRITDTIHEDRYTYFIISRSVLLRLRNVLDKHCRGSQNPHFVFNIFFFNRAVYEIMWNGLIERGRPQMTIWCKRIACWIPKSTNTHSQ